MSKKILAGKKVAVLIETEYIPQEAAHYKNEFAKLGAIVHFMAHLWGKEKMTIVSDVTEPGQKSETMDVTIEVQNVDANDYDVVIMAANYCSVRLREIPPMGNLACTTLLDTPPAVKFYADAMRNKDIVKGALCHALWILTPVPELLKGRRVICHTVVLADVHNAGAIYVPHPSGVVVDDDLVTGRSIANIEPYFNEIVKKMTMVEQEEKSCAV